jgi:hypothetical protein
MRQQYFVGPGSPRGFRVIRPSTLKLYAMGCERPTTSERHQAPARAAARRRRFAQRRIAEKKARSIKYQLSIAKLPLAKDLDEFDFTGTPINEVLVRRRMVAFSPSSATPC